MLFMDTLSSYAVAVDKIYGITYNVLLYKHPVADTCAAAATNMFREMGSGVLECAAIKFAGTLGRLTVLYHLFRLCGVGSNLLTHLFVCFF